LFEEIRKNLRDYTFVSFQWSGADTSAARTIAAESLARWIRRYKFHGDEPLRLLGHSHGGNVLLSAIAFGLGRPVDDLVLMSTPIREDYARPSVFAVKNLIDVANFWDTVQKHGGGQHTWKGNEFGKASPFIPADHHVQVDKVPFSLDPFAAHGVSRSPEVFRNKVLPLLSSRRQPAQKPAKSHSISWTEEGP
jgi:hypothetical protein